MQVIITNEKINEHLYRIRGLGDACDVFTFLFKPESSNVDTDRKTLNKLLSMKD